MRSTKTRLAASMVVLGALVAVSSSAVAATSTDATLTGGTLTATTPSTANFTGVTLNGSAQSTPAAVGAFSVSDATGSGAGWKVTAQGTQFKEYAAGVYVTSGKTLPVSSLKLTAPTVGPAAGTTSASPSVAAGPTTIDSGGTGGAVSIASAALNTGMGTYNFTATTMTLSVPASAYAATYRSDVTITVASTP